MNALPEGLTAVAVDSVRGHDAREVFRLLDDDSDMPPPDLLTLALQGVDRTPLCRGLLHTRSGEPLIYVDAGAAPIRDDDGRLLGCVLVFRDVTQRRLDELELRRYRDHLEALVRERTADLEAARLEAERASQAKTGFLSSMSHELRTPMNAVIGFSDLLTMDGLPERQSGYVRHIREAGVHLLHLIDDLLDLGKVAAGHLVVQHAPVAVDEALQQALRMVQSLAATMQIDIVVDAPPEPYGVLADPTRLVQVLVNLLSNALKYNRMQGWVLVSCSAPAGARVRIAVADSGSGIAAENQARLFHAFERLGAETGHVSGSGIGLAFSKHLTELMQGQLGFESTVSVGSTFWIELQRCAPPDAAGPVAP